MMSIRLQGVLLIAVAALLGVAAVQFVRIKAEEMRELNGEGEVDEQVAEGLSHRSTAALERLSAALLDDASCTKTIEKALALKAARTPQPFTAHD